MCYIFMLPVRRDLYTAAKFIEENLRLCIANIRNIEEISTYGKEREKREEIKRRIRVCQNALCMAGDRRRGCLYRESMLEPDTQKVTEHPIPLRYLVNQIVGKSIELELLRLVFKPVAVISRKSDRELRKNGRGVEGGNEEFPFRRYINIGSNNINIEMMVYNPENNTWDKLDCENWSIKDHFDLVDKVVGLGNVYAAIKQELIKNHEAAEATKMVTIPKQDEIREIA